MNQHLSRLIFLWRLSANRQQLIPLKIARRQERFNYFINEQN